MLPNSATLDSIYRQACEFYRRRIAEMGRPEDASAPDVLAPDASAFVSEEDRRRIAGECAAEAVLVFESVMVTVDEHLDALARAAAPMAAGNPDFPPPPR